MNKIIKVLKFFIPTNKAQLTGFVAGCGSVIIFYIFLNDPLYGFLAELLPKSLVDNFLFRILFFIIFITPIYYVLLFSWDTFFDKASRCWRAYDKGKFKSVIKIATPMAERGDTDFEYLLGITYDNEEYPFHESKRAIEWLSRAAKKKHEFAQFHLGCIYDEGRDGIKPNYENAVKWFELASKSGLYTKSGFDIAQWNLGLIKLNIDGKPIDLDGALRAFKLAGEQGNLQSLIMLAALYFDGDHYPQDFQKCFEYSKLAVEHGAQDGLADYMLANIYENGLGVPKNTKEAIKWYRQSIKYGDFDSMNNLGIMYYYGNGIEKNEQEGERLLKLASESGSEDAKLNLEIIQNNSLPEKYKTALDKQRQKVISKVEAKNSSSNIITFPSRK